ncbi:MAG: response regulator [Candidatus Omnitrophica bacterium]|nr:response regulator [Candidatus Omnitrophota bacterium]
MAQKVLIIDDDRTNIQLVKSWLKNNDYEVLAAIDGVAGLQMLEREQPDLIILDVEMPQMNGFTFLNQLRKNSEHAAIPVIVLTSHEENQPIFQLKGVRAYLIKPVKGEDLMVKVKECLKQ